MQIGLLSELYYCVSDIGQVPQLRAMRFGALVFYCPPKSQG